MPRKKLKTVHDDSVRNEQPCSSNNCTNLPQTSFFCLLPAEILEKIFNYLNPPDLISIRELNIPRFTEISRTVRHADFSKCNTVQTEDVLAFFTKDTIPYIQEINFNYIFHVKNSTLVKYITKCKRLKKLSVYEAGLTHADIVFIIQGCKELEELYWSANETTPHDRNYPSDPIPSRLKKLYMNTKTFNGGFHIVSDILKRFGSIGRVCYTTSPCFATSLPPCMNRNIFVGQSNVLGCPVNIAYSYENRVCNVSTPFNSVDRLFEGLISERAFERRNQTDLSSIATSPSSFLQVLTEVDDLNAIPSLPPNSIHSFVLIMTDEDLCLESHIEKLSRITGTKLKNFAVHDMTPRFASNPSDGQNEIQLEGKILRALVTKITSTCINIQVLNLTDIHFHEPFCFQSLFRLTRLKILNLPACIFKTEFTTSTLRSDPKEAAKLQLQMFEDFVLKTKDLERFYFYGCLSCFDGPTDEEFMSISKWPKLTHLLIYKVRTFRLCHFLLRVADLCPNLTSLEIIEVGSGVCHFIPNVLHVLRKSKQLMFLRINQKAFNPVNNFFWKNIALAKNLQGLCLCFDLNTVVENKMITNALVQLPFIHLFHLHGRRMTNNLFDHINQIMNQNGIQNKRIEITHLDTSSVREECLLPHFLI